MLAALLLTGCFAADVASQELRVTLAPETHRLDVSSTMHATGGGPLAFELSSRLTVDSIVVDGRTIAVDGKASRHGLTRYEVATATGATTIEVTAHGTFEEDIEAGEKPGQIHNFSVDAHIGPQGVFLSDGAAWHPRPIGANGRPSLETMTIAITPIEGWAFVASGDPAKGSALDQPTWSWATPRPVDGLALVGNRHQLRGVVHETKEGPVEIVMHVPAEHADKVDLYLKAAAGYLDLYVPLLGRFPYRRFSIVENFFSSGFAYPGFTLLGPQVVGMAPRSLVPGYLDHELMHNWWGNGVYVSPSDGNWCEALTSFSANYYRRLAEDGPAAGRAYRRDLLMKLSTDPDGLDNGPVGAFGSANPAGGGPDRFVGYDKGSFVFLMLSDVLDDATHAAPADHGKAMWASLRRFADGHLGQFANWSDLQAAFEAAVPGRPAGWLDGFFATWVRDHTRPTTIVDPTSARVPGDPIASFAAQLPASTLQTIDTVFDAGGRRAEIDPEFRIYRVLPASQLVPTISGTTGPGGLRVETKETRKEVAAFVPQLEASDSGANLVLIGAEAIGKRASLIATSSDPIVVTPTAFTVGGKEYAKPTNAVLHTINDPEHPGRYVTIFHSNGDAGWSRLRLIRFYGRDTTIVWDGDTIVERRVHEPERWIALPASGRGGS